MVIEKEKNEITMNKTHWRRSMLITFILMFFVIVIAVISHSSELLPLILVPMIYIVFEVFFSGLTNFLDAPGLMLLNGLYFIRYFALPLLTLFNGDSYIATYRTGIWLLIYEEVVCAIVLYFLMKKRQRDVCNEQEYDYFSKSRKLYSATFFFLILSAVIIFLRPSIIKNYNLIFGLTNERLNYIESIESNSSSFDIIILDITRLLVPASIGVFFANRYKNSNKEIDFILSLVLSVLFSMLVIRGVDRGTVVLHGVAVAFLVFKILPEKQQTIKRIIIIFITVVVLYLITARMVMSSAHSGLARYGGVENIINYIQAYVAGIKNMSIVVTMKAEYGSSVTLATPLNDLFANVPFMSHLVDSSNRCLRYFNNAYGRIGTDQVMPIIGNGVMYFGYILSPLFSALMIRVVFWCDKKYRSASNVFSAFIWSFASAMLAFCHYQNLQLIMLYLTCRILPLVFVYYIFMRVRFKIRRG